MFNRRALFLVLVCRVVSVGYAEDWRQSAKQRNLSSEQIGELAQNKILATDKHVSQIFSPYIEPRMPVFITADSILNAYHVLLEESVLRLEQANSTKLPGILRFVWQNLETADQQIQGDPQLVAAAKARAQIVLGTAMRLLGDAPLETNAETAALILEEVDRVTAANAIPKPKWLGTGPDPRLIAIDYSRYRPRGFYDQTEGLSRYFRAVSWLQSIPFRVDNDEQLLAILMLGSGLAEERFASDDAKRKEFAAFFECYRELLGDRDDWDLMIAASAAPPGLKLDLRSGDLEKIRNALKSKAKATGHRPLINDQISIQPGELPLSLRVISAHRTPDAILFGRTTGMERPFPSGLEVCIALGSDYAKQRFEDPDKDGILATIDESRDVFHGSSLYFDYMGCISALLDAPPPNAPAFMSLKPWQSKSCQTALAGWAQLRHTWSLQAKQVFSVKFAEEWEPPVGFVEPDPLFFARLEELAERTGSLFDRAGAEINEDFCAIARLQDLMDVLEAKAASGKGLDDWSTRPERFAYFTLCDVMGRPSDEMSQTAAKQFLDRAIAKTKDLLAQIQRGERSGKEYAGWGRWLWNRPVDELWTELAKVSARLRALAEKQLNNERFDEEDRDFIVTYGQHLAPLMFHIPSPSATPRDDVPRIVDVVCDPLEERYMEVGVGRPRIIYVLYPTERGEVLCRGAILPYYEFLSRKRLTDLEWKQILDSSDVPAQPEWVTSFGQAADEDSPVGRASSLPFPADSQAGSLRHGTKPTADRLETKSDLPAQPERVTSPEVEEPLPRSRAERNESAIPFEHGLFPRSKTNPNKPPWQVISRQMYAIGTPAVRWLDDDRRIVVESATWSSRVFDTKTWEMVDLLPSLGQGHKTSAAQSPDGRWIVTADGNRHRLCFRSSNGKHITAGRLFSPSRLNWDPTSRRLVAVESNRRITIWLANGEKELDLGEISTIVSRTAWSPSGNQLAASNFDGMVYVWELPPVRAVEPSPEHIGRTTRRLSREFSFDTGKKYPFLRWASEDTLTTQSSSGPITLWATDGRKKCVIERPERCTPQWSPDGQALAIQVGFRMEICSLDGTKVRNKIDLPRSYGRFAWSQDSQRLAILAWRRQLLVWDVYKQDQPVQVANATEDDLNLIVQRPVQWTPDDKRLTCGSRDPAIRIWNSNGTPAKSWATPGRWTHKLSLLPSGKQLASRSWPEQRTRIWDLDGKEAMLETKVNFFAPVANDRNHVARSPDGRSLAQTRDGVQVYDAQNTQCVELNGQCLEPGSATWSSDGAKIACPTQFNTVIVWDAATGQVEWVGLPLENAKSATVAADGRLFTDDRDAFDKQYCFAMKDAEGKTVFLNSNEFEATINRN